MKTDVYRIDDSPVFPFVPLLFRGLLFFRMTKKLVITVWYGGTGRFNRKL